MEVHRTEPRPSLPVVTLWASYLTPLGLGFLIYKIWMIIGLNQLTYVRWLEWSLAHSKHILAAIIILRPLLYCVHFNFMAPNIFFCFPFFWHNRGAFRILQSPTRDRILTPFSGSARLNHWQSRHKILNPYFFWWTQDGILHTHGIYW